MTGFVLGIRCFRCSTDVWGLYYCPWHGYIKACYPVLLVWLELCICALCLPVSLYSFSHCFVLFLIFVSHIITIMAFRKLLEERNKNTSDSFYFRIYVLVLGVYAGVRVLFALLLKFPSCHRLSEMSEHPFFQFFKWIYEVLILVFCLIDKNDLYLV